MPHTPSDITSPGTFTVQGRPLLSPMQMRAGGAMILLLVLAGLWTLRPFLPALGWGAILAISLWPWYQRQCARWPWARRWVAPSVVTLLVALALVLPLAMVVSAIAHDRAALMQWLGQIHREGIAPPDVLNHLPLGDRIAAWWQDNLGQPGALSKFSHAHGDGALPLGEGGHFVSEIVRRVLTMLFTLLVLFFLLCDGGRVALAMRFGSRRGFGPAGENVGEQIVAAIRGTVNGLVVVGLGEGVLLGLAYAVAGVPHPALFGLLTGLLSAVPLGAVLAFAAAAALLAAGGAIGAALAILGIGSFVVFVADHFVRPVLIGGSTRLPFLWVLLGILGGIEAWGLIGLVLGPALMAALMLLWREWTGEQAGPLNPAPSCALQDEDQPEEPDQP